MVLYLTPLYQLNFSFQKLLKIIFTLAKKTAEKSWIATEKKFNGNVVLGSCLVPFYPHGDWKCICHLPRLR